MNLLDVCNDPITDGIQLLKLSKENANEPKEVLNRLPIGKTEDPSLNRQVASMATSFIKNYYKYVTLIVFK